MACTAFRVLLLFRDSLSTHQKAEERKQRKLVGDGNASATRRSLRISRAQLKGTNGIPFTRAFLVAWRSRVRALSLSSRRVKV